MRYQPFAYFVIAPVPVAAPLLAKAVSKPLATSKLAAIIFVKLVSVRRREHLVRSPALTKHDHVYVPPDAIVTSGLRVRWRPPMVVSSISLSAVIAPSGAWIALASTVEMPRFAQG